MPRKLYVAFYDRGQAEKAVGALWDYGVRKEDVSVVIDQSENDAVNPVADSLDRAAKVGISRTSAEDAGAGAAKGAGVGLAAGLAAILIPGLGYGAGALATAILAGAVGMAVRT